MQLQRIQSVLTPAGSFMIAIYMLSACGSSQPRVSSQPKAAKLILEISHFGVPVTYTVTEPNKIATIENLIDPNRQTLMSESKSRPAIALDHMDMRAYDGSGKEILGEHWQIVVEGRKPKDPLVPILHQIESLVGSDPMAHGDDVPRF